MLSRGRRPERGARRGGSQPGVRQASRCGGELEKKQTKGVPLLNASCAGNDLDTAGASEKGALVTVTTVDPRRNRREVGANRLQDSGSFAPVRRQNAQLERLENTAVRDEVNRDRARQTTEGLTDGDRP